MAVDWLQLFLDEDLGDGDITSQAMFRQEHTSTASIVARQRCFVAGLPEVADIFARLSVASTANISDGQWVERGAILVTLAGPTRGILAGERLALNLLSRMSGVATMTRQCVEALARECSPAMVAGTRKTTPGLRAFEKRAIAVAGGEPHRMGLYDAAMVKDNHIAAAGGLESAVAKIRSHAPGKEITVEVESLQDGLLAAKAGADWLLIDNQAPATGAAWAKEICGKYAVKIEASGGITPETVTAFGWADRISMGCLTQNIQQPDLALDWPEA